MDSGSHIIFQQHGDKQLSHLENTLQQVTGHRTFMITGCVATETSDVDRQVLFEIRFFFALMTFKQVKMNDH